VPGFRAEVAVPGPGDVGPLERIEVRRPERCGGGLGERRVHVREDRPDGRQAVGVALFDEVLGVLGQLLALT
jgi:hypothetical protein